MNNINNAKWIWDNTPSSKNKYVIFKKEFSMINDAKLQVTANARYFCYLNGKLLGNGVIRSYSNPYYYDTYDINENLLENNTLIFICLDVGETNFQYTYSPCGLKFAIFNNDTCIISDTSTLVSLYNAYQKNSRRVSLTMYYEEIFDANLDYFYNESTVSFCNSTDVNETLNNVHKVLLERPIPFLQEEIIQPVNIYDETITNKNKFSVCFDLRTAICPPLKNASPFITNLMVVISLEAENDITVNLSYSHGYYNAYLNGEKLNNNTFNFKQGKNNIQIIYDNEIRFFYETLLVFDTDKLKFNNLKLIGAFSLTEEQKDRPYGFGYAEKLNGIDLPYNKVNLLYEKILKNNSLENIEYITDISNLIIDNSSMNDFYKSSVIKKSNTLTINENSFTLSPNLQDTRILIDFGKEYTGYIDFTINASKNSVLDFVFFEFIQPDNRVNLADGICNSMRYIAREGKQHYRSLYLRGFKYCYITIKNAKSIIFDNINVIFSHYPFSNRGDFACDNILLNKIYEVGVHTTKCCMTDTYIDCPTYEQVLWIGDMRVQALCDYTINGNTKLWFRCLKLCGESLQFSPITQSQVPTGWYNIIPAWTFLYMTSVYEYYLHTGDIKGSNELFIDLEKNFEGIKQYTNKLGLFEIRAWNMFDWADMDTPEDGIVTHQNCLLYQALKNNVLLAKQLGKDKQANEMDTYAEKLKLAINKNLYNEKESCFCDCLRYCDNSYIQSDIFSQQTQTVAYLTNACNDERKNICKKYITNPKSNFVLSGSPFFEFFKIDSIMQDSQEQAFIDTISKSWGFMIEMNATTFWEMWSGKLVNGTRLTRSHCHGWSSAPVYFFKSFILGVNPVEAGYKKVSITPHLCNLQFAKGIIPTPYGDIKIEITNNNGKTETHYVLPDGITAI